ncbi:DNA-directed RNA polymerases II and IV subunit 5A-like [Rosa rugosa]|uniref:DNA-directed RNA polymerases II and IV subunit 5A-like n=1 Tax=Rosa rugosa TaxID=74645 RepID=UPI002B40C0E5|nr:DNA-directed RNA polymerases II and IV subunit 5A-like [Rosa rugosa]XP_061995635.1 DNA-directed RNA polymerases II and IV subunit 5A-like [Rosa rugosa]XP_061998403.1 DNA-directed RNA polymerases II and IV subunit 5A-like [Rosa rugosa]XP_062025682.1 DNA-directed RNA polymerases II and IV subunit 5A-like [Rosa rugosa]
MHRLLPLHATLQSTMLLLPYLRRFLAAISQHLHHRFDSISELLVNVTKHVLQPKYEILTAEEKKHLLRKYKLEDKKIEQPLMRNFVSNCSRL